MDQPLPIGPDPEDARLEIHDSTAADYKLFLIQVGRSMDPGRVLDPSCACSHCFQAGLGFGVPMGSLG